MSQCTPSYHVADCDGFCGAQALRHAGGRPRGATMPCGWGCGAVLTAREMREHFTDCPKKPMIPKSREQHG